MVRVVRVIFRICHFFSALKIVSKSVFHFPKIKINFLPLVSLVSCLLFDITTQSRFSTPDRPMATPDRLRPTEWRDLILLIIVPDTYPH